MNATNESRGTPQRFRLSTGGLVDRRRSTTFTFDGRRLSGLAGDTLASALLANGIRLVGRSFKYHRPRGFLSAGPEEPNGLVELGTGARREPNTKATIVPLTEGLEAASQNRWPSLGFDLGAINSLFSPFFPAGFYYKTFMWPAALWERLYEPVIRRAAGLGRASGEPDPDACEKANAFCDVLVIGSGPAGLAAALAAGRAGARVILCEEDFIFGGRLNSERRTVGGTGAANWAQQAIAELAAMPEVRLMKRTAVFGLYDGGTHGAIETCDHAAGERALPRLRLWRIVACTTVLAAGAIERPIAFGGNDRPGVMLASAVRTYLNRFAVAPGSHAAVFTAGDDGWRTVHDLVAAGVAVAAVIDPRERVSPTDEEAARKAGAAVFTGAEVAETRGGRALSGIRIVDRDGRRHTVDCDLLAVSGGWNPTLALATHLGNRPRWSDSLAAFVPGDLPPGMIVAGAAGGRLTTAECLADGMAAGVRAADTAGFPAAAPDVPVTDDEPNGLSPLWHVSAPHGKAFVDFQNDVTLHDVDLAVREGFRSVEHMKRYTTLGMATDQGRTSAVIAHATLAGLTGRTIAETGTTTFRPPYAPVPIAAFAGRSRGRHFRPTRLTAGHAWAAAHGASFVEAGQWLRAQWFAEPQERDWLETVNREVATVRNQAGVCDVSTLGKIDIQGTDAGAFLDRVYTNVVSSLPVGKARYGLMLREDGFVMDDGTAARLGHDHFVISTTTANAAGVMQHLEFCHQVLWPEFDVQMVSVTEQWAQYAVAGPRSRALLERLLGSAIDLSPDGFPFLACAGFEIDGVPLRLFRISFSGELAYEIAIPARFGEALLAELLAAGRPLGAAPYGTEALGVLRIEKGHVAGAELNGQTTAADLGLGRMMSRKKDFIGRVMATRPGLTDPDRPALVGLIPVDRSERLRAGSHFLARGAAASLDNDEGYLTSAAFSPALGHWIGLGLLCRGPQRHGERVRAFDPVRGGDTEVEVVAPVFFDPEGERLHA